jgi:NTP pyrophosphatase (non-canonical NTP hydrolase)
MFDLRQLQQEQKVWADHNFPNRHPYQPLLGALEELGELAHHHLKADQGIRGTAEMHREKAKDAVGDLMIYLADYCNQEKFDMQEILEQTWGEVKLRDWRKDPETGGTGERDCPSFKE